MNRRSLVCSACRQLNSASDSRCMACGNPLRGPRAWMYGMFSSPGSATTFILGFCLLDFAMMVVIGGSIPWGLFGPSATPEAMYGVGAVQASLGQVQPWRLLSATFAHGSVLHLGMNMYAFLSFGRRFEEEHGSARLLLVYAATGIFGFWLSGVIYGPYGPPTLGASGALFGFVGIEVGKLVRLRDARAKQVFLSYLFMAVALAVVLPVNNWAHLGGFCSGFPLGLALAKSLPSKRRPFGLQMAAVATAALSIASVVLSLASLYFWRQAA